MLFFSSLLTFPAMPTPPRHLLVAALLLVVGSALIASGAARWGWRLLAPLALPAQRVLAEAGAPPAPGDNGSRDLAEQVARLGAENAQLRNRLTERDEVDGPWGAAVRDAVLARGRIIARPSRQGRRFCVLDVGEAQGVSIGLAVVSGFSLVGVVAGISESTCLVRQVTDSQNRCPAALYYGKELAAEGVVAGNGRRDALDLLFVEDRPGLDLALVPGGHVVTGAVGTLVPPNLVLGRVLSAERSAITAGHWHVRLAPLRIAEAVDSVHVLRAPGEARPGL